MSRGARWTLGGAMLLIAAGFAAIPLTFPLPSRGANCILGALAGFAGLVALACFSAAVRPVAVRIVAAAVLAVSIGYVATQAAAVRSLADVMPWWHDGPSFHKSLLFLGIFGLPSAHVVRTGRYPTWGRHTRAFEPTTRQADR